MSKFQWSVRQIAGEVQNAFDAFCQDAEDDTDAYGKPVNVLGWAGPIASGDDRATMILRTNGGRFRVTVERSK